MISEMMKSSIPRSWGSTRELRFAGGGPWWSWSSWACPWAIAAASMVSWLRGGRGLGGHVVDGLAGRPAHAVDQVGAHPARAGRRQRRDDDVVDAEELHAVHRRGVRVRVADHAGGEQAVVAQALQDLREAGAGLARMQPLAALLGDDH